MDGTSLMWMPPETTMPPLRTLARAPEARSSDWREDDGGIELVGGCSSELPAHVAPELPRKGLGRSYRQRA